jgi:hypothetical protein
MKYCTMPSSHFLFPVFSDARLSEVISNRPVLSIKSFCTMVLAVLSPGIWDRVVEASTPNMIGRMTS